MFKRKNLILLLAFTITILIIGSFVFMITKAAEFGIPESDHIAIYTPDEAAVLILSNQTEEVSDTKIELSEVRLGKQAITGIVCYPVPSDADWLIEGITLTVEEKVFTDYKMALKEWFFSDGGVKTHRCDNLVIPLDASISAPSITIAIKRLSISVPEVPDCVKVQERLDVAQTGIVISCEHGPGYFNFDIRQKPGSMSEIAAIETIRDAFHDAIIEGPWVFKIPINQ